MATSDTLIDQVFDGRYRLLRKLGTGGMANVYLAEDQELGRRVAIKMLDERHAQDEQFVERFRREAKNAAGLSHPNIVSIYDRGEAEGTYYIAMEYLEGRTLKELLVTRGPTPVRIAIDYTRQILAALAFAHRHGIVHRDIKPHNVVVAPDGRLKVTDFGIARSGTSQMTEAGSIIGTAQYLSPEQARGAPVNPSSDLYSVGIVLYEMLTGSVPFTGDTPLEIAMKHLSAVPEPPSAKREDIPHELDSIVLRALAKDPEDRYQSAPEMDADLARVAQGLPVTTRTEEAATAVLAGAGIDTAPTRIVSRGARTDARTPPPYAPGRYYEYEEPIRRRPLWPWVLALLLLVAAGFAGYYVYSKIEGQLAKSSTVSVPFVRGQTEALARDNLIRAGLKPKIKRVPNENVEIGNVFDQDPSAGVRVGKDSTVTILVSSGKPKATVPDLVGKRLEDAVAAILAAHLKYKTVPIHSDKETGTVTGQNPKAGTRVLAGDTVRINVSKGPRPIAVPPVVGQPFASAASTLQAAGFAVAPPNLVDSSEPKGTVVGMDPKANTLQPRGTTIVLDVSKGPQTSTVPDVTSQDQATAVATLKASGFKVAVAMVPTNDPASDGIVLSQNPEGLTQAKSGTLVRIAVGKFVAPPPTETIPTETIPTIPTETIPTETIPTETIPTETTPTAPPPAPPAPGQ